MRPTYKAVAVAALLTITLTACGSSDPEPTDPAKIDTAADLACEDLAKGYKGAQTTQARIDLADKVNKWAQDSGTNGIADNATALARASEAGPDAWQLGADVFAKTCLDAGWKA